MEGVQPWRAAATPHRGNCAKHTKRRPTELNYTSFPFDSFCYKSERNRENIGKKWDSCRQRRRKGICTRPCSHSGVTWDLSLFRQTHSWALNLAVNVSHHQCCQRKAELFFTQRCHLRQPYIIDVLQHLTPVFQSALWQRINWSLEIPGEKNRSSAGKQLQRLFSEAF